MMKKPLGVIGRLLNRGSASPLVAAIHTHAFGRPLLIHGGIGEQLIGAYLEGAVDAPPPVAGPTQESRAGKVAVINISGALVARPMPGLCDEGPVNYEAIREVFDEAMADGNIGAIVFRIDSPGGMASNLFDLTDHIYESRGSKPIHAVVDDYAYSAAYAIAASCDEVWVSRTGQGGSVGAACFHKYVGAADAQAGVKFTAVYSGTKKIDWNSHFPLSPEALAEAQAEIDELRELFVASVATYRGLDADAVRSTEAGTYRAQAAIDVGFATKLGTFRDALASLQASAPPPAATEGGEGDGGDDKVEGDTTDPALAVTEPGAEPAPPAVPVAAAAVSAAADTGNDDATVTAALTAAVVAAKLPAVVAMAVLKTKAELSVDSVEAFIASAREIADLCAAAKLESLAPDFVEQGLAVEIVREKLADAAASTGPELVTTPPAVTAGQTSSASTNRLDPTRIYANRGN